MSTINNVGNNFANVRFTPTDAYDVDPTLGSTSMPGFSELGALYRKYRVVAFSATIRFSNNEAFALTLYAGPANADPGANTASYNNYIPNKAFRKFVLSAKGGRDAGVISHRVSVSNFGGAANLDIEDGYSSLTTGGPNNNVWYMIGMYSASNFVSGIWYNMDLDIEMEFYELSNPSN